MCSVTRNDADDDSPIVAKAHSLVQLARAGVVAHHMQERRFVAQHLAADQLEHQPLREATALKVRMRADAADLAQVYERSPAIAISRGPSKTPKYSPSSMVQAERTGIRQLGELERLRRVLRV